MDSTKLLVPLLSIAWLAPLASFAVLAIGSPWFARAQRLAAGIATGAILLAAAASHAALWLVWLPTYGVTAPAAGPVVVAGQWATLAEFGSLRFSIGYYVDGLAVVMFALVTSVSACVHIYSFGYMRSELEAELADPEAKLASGASLRLPGRFHLFYQYLSLFSCSMLGIVLSGNLLMTFVFWELVGLASYLLIGFYYERKKAAAAAMKAFVVNRVGDAGLLVGLMAVLAAFSTLEFGPTPERPGLFQCARLDADLTATIARLDNAPPGADERAPPTDALSNRRWLLFMAGLGIFCGCVGKSAQAPLHVWLPDAMEGPTPVSALVHSATMVAAGVFLVARCYPLLSSDALLVIAIVGAVTLLLASSVAIVATDIKRVLAWSTIGQLGLMMLSLGVGGWTAALFHLVTHAAFKSLLFLGAGSVIHATHTNEMPLLGGLRTKLPWTAATMLIGCLAIAGAGIPSLIGLSGYYSKDAIIVQTLAFGEVNPAWGAFYYIALAGAGATSFAMFRMWWMTFTGRARDPFKYADAHESPRAMVGVLVLLAALSIGLGWRFGALGLEPLLASAEPRSYGAVISRRAAGDRSQPTDGAAIATAGMLASVRYPEAEAALALHGQASWAALGAGLAGFGLATLFYGLRILDPREVQQQFTPAFRILRNAWYIDRAYARAIVGPVEFCARFLAAFDRRWIDGLLDQSARGVRWLGRLDDDLDRRFVDGAVNALGAAIHGAGLSLRMAQTGQLRQYVLLIAVGTVTLFLAIRFSLGGG